MRKLSLHRRSLFHVWWVLKSRALRHTMSVMFKIVLCACNCDCITMLQVQEQINLARHENCSPVATPDIETKSVWHSHKNSSYFSFCFSVLCCRIHRGEFVCASVFGEACSCLEQTDMSSGPVGDVWERQQQYTAGWNVSNRQQHNTPTHRRWSQWAM